MTDTHKARLGLLIPSSNTVMELDLRRGLSDVANIYSARMYLVETTEAAEAAMLDTFLPQAVTDIASLRPAVTVFGCTSAGALRGPDYDRQLCERIADEAGSQVVSTIGAVSQAISASGRTKIAVLTPYVDELNQRISSSLESQDLDVLGIEGLGISDNFLLAEPTSEEIAQRGIALIRETSPEQLFISCTNFRALEAAEAIEAATDVPVVTSNQAVTTAVRRALDKVQA